MEVSDWRCDRDALASKSLRKLSFIDIRYQSMERHIEISCPNLEELSMKFVENWNSPCVRLSGKTIDFVISSSPILHTLELSDLCFSGQLVIASKSLKNLVLGRIRGISDLQISCPCLEASNLYHFSGSVLDSKCLALKILWQLQHVRLLEIGSWLIQALEAEGSSSLCLNCKCMTVDGTDFDRRLPAILSAIRCSPQLEKLDIKFPLHQYKNLVASQGLLNDGGKENSSNSDGVVFNWSVSNLKAVRIIGLSEKVDNCKLVFKFVEFLLKNGKALEKIVFILADCGKRFIFDLSKKLLSLPRNSPYPNIELCSMYPNV